MANKFVKDLIDKMLIDDISEEEMNLILKGIEASSELQNYYQSTLTLKENLQSIADEKPFSNDDLQNSRYELFNSIDASKREFSLFHLVASIAATFILCVSYFTLIANHSDKTAYSDLNALELRNYPKGELLNLDFDNSDKDHIVLTGKAVSHFEVEGSLKDEFVQDLIKKTAKSDLNISHRLRALQLLEYSNESNELLLELIKNETDNTLVRREALRRLAELTKGSNLLATYINLLKEENNIQMQEQLIDIIKNYQEKNQSYEEIEKLLNTKASKNLQLKS